MVVRPVHAILITHTADRLRRTILGLASSSRRPDSAVLACDGDDEGIRLAARAAAAEAGLRLTLVRRAFAGVGRAAQIRNNAVRALLEAGAEASSRLVFFDGDCVPLHRTIERHEEAMSRADLVIGWRYDLTAEQDAGFDESALRSGAMPFSPTADQTAAIARRDRRYRLQAFWRRLGLTKPHKPKLLSANFGCTLEAYVAVNGFDEAFEGWGQEDDDFGRRIHESGRRVHVGVRDILVCHQHHMTRAPGEWSSSANAGLLAASRPMVCEWGLRSPVEQGVVRVEVVGGDRLHPSG